MRLVSEARLAEVGLKYGVLARRREGHIPPVSERVGLTCEALVREGLAP